jgi:hypothetical protein
MGMLINCFKEADLVEGVVVCDGVSKSVVL